MVEYSLYVNQLHLHFAEVGKLLRILPISVHVNVLSVLCVLKYVDWRWVCATVRASHFYTPT